MRHVIKSGQSGTGKELLAKTLHYQSRRAEKAFVAVNLAALPESLIESELCGVEKGAFTGAGSRRPGRFEKAARGTLFLDEIGELPLAIQVKLLRVLQERVFERVGSSETISTDVRIVAATNRDLSKEVAHGRFREELYWRLNVVPIKLPPLRRRERDIPLLVNHYLQRFTAAHNRVVFLAPEAMEALVRYEWPGNIRELANTVERLIIMAEQPVISDFALPRHIRGGAHASGFSPEKPESRAGQSLGREIEILEKEKILNALRESGGNQQRASMTLGLTPRQLGYRIKKYGINLKIL